MKATPDEARPRAAAALAAFEREQLRLAALARTTPPPLLDRELLAEWHRITLRAIGLLAGRPADPPGAQS